MKLSEDIEVDDKEFLQDMLNSLELQLTWLYSEEEKEEHKKSRDEIMMMLNKYDEKHSESKFLNSDISKVI